MKKTEHTMVILDIGSSTTKGLLGSLSEEAPVSDEKPFFELQGVFTPTRGLSKKGVLHDKRALRQSIEEVCSSLSRSSGYELLSAHILFTHPKTRFFTKTIGTNSIKHTDGIYITEDWLAIKRELVLSHIQKRHPQQTCTYFAFTSLLADGEEILYDHFEFTAHTSLSLTYRYAVTPTTFIEGLREVIEQVVTVNGFHPTGTTFDCFLTDQQKDRGVLACSVGAQYTTLATHLTAQLAHLQTLPFGGMMLTDEIALIEKFSLEEAEEYKRMVGTAESPLTKKAQQSIEKKLVQRFKNELLPDIRSMQTTESFPGGIVLTGGGAQYATFAPLLEKVTGLRTRYAPTPQKVQCRQSSDQALWQSAYGLLYLLSSGQVATNHITRKESGISALLKRFLHAVRQLFS